MRHAPKIKSIVFGFHKRSKQDMISFIDRFRISNLAQHEDKANIGLIERPRRFDPMFVVNITYILYTHCSMETFTCHCLYDGFQHQLWTKTLDIERNNELFVHCCC